MSKTFRNFPKAVQQPKAPKPQPRDKSCGLGLKTVAQNFRRELRLESGYA